MLSSYDAEFTAIKTLILSNILFLLYKRIITIILFQIRSFSAVYYGLKNHKTTCFFHVRNKYKLFLTSVVPPDRAQPGCQYFPLLSLQTWCLLHRTIPHSFWWESWYFCCSDKTGTLTSDDLVVEGVAGLDGEGVTSKDGVVVCPVSEATLKSVQVLAACHSPVMLLFDFY